MGTLSLPLGEGVQFVGAILELCWSQKKGNRKFREEIFFNCLTGIAAESRGSSTTTFLPGRQRLRAAPSRIYLATLGLLFQLWGTAPVPGSSSFDFLLMHLRAACGPCLAAGAEIAQWPGFLAKASDPRRAKAACELCLVGFSCRLSFPEAQADSTLLG